MWWLYLLFCLSLFFTWNSRINQFLVEAKFLSSTEVRNQILCIPWRSMVFFSLSFLSCCGSGPPEFLQSLFLLYLLPNVIDVMIVIILPGPDWPRHSCSLNCSCHFCSHLQVLLKVITVNLWHSNQLMTNRPKRRLNLALESMEAKEAKEALKDESACSMLPEKNSTK